MYCSLALNPPLSSFIQIYRPTWTSDLCEDTDSALRELRSELRNFGAGPPKKLAPGPCGPCLGEIFRGFFWKNLIWGPALLHFCLRQAKRELLGSKSRSKDLIPGIPCLQIVDLMWIFALAALFVCLVGVRCDTVEYVFDCTWIVLVVRLQH